MSLSHTGNTSVFNRGLSPAEIVAHYTELDGDCWLYRGTLRDGYGRITRDGVAHQAHRLIYEFLVGPIPDGLQLDHLCRRRACCNPDHVEPVTQQENIARGARRPGCELHITTCVRGHELTPDNVAYWDKSRPTKRWCKACSRLRGHRAVRP